MKPNKRNTGDLFILVKLAVVTYLIGALVSVCFNRSGNLMPQVISGIGVIIALLFQIITELKAIREADNG